MSNSDKITSNLLQSMSIIANQAINNTSFDRTVQATIVSCLDATIGEYKVKYQDGTWIAFSQNVNTTYVNGTSVYVLIPNGDMRNVKTIIGTTKQLGINYINVVNEINKYQKNGSNVITNSNEYGLCSYQQNTIVLYDANRESELNVIDVDTVAAPFYLQDSTHFITSALVRTDLPVQQRYNGNYGIRYYIDVLNKSDEEDNIVTRIYTLDVNSMQGNVYLFTNATTQTSIFQIEQGSFQRIKRIELFVDSFPNESLEQPNDIFISDLTLVGATAFTEGELNGVSVEVLTRGGNLFTDMDSADNTRTVEAQVRVAGRVINNSVQKLDFYWFVQNSGINARSRWYSKYGGQGWKCLNTYKTVGQGIYDFNPGTYKYTIKKSEVTSSKMTYKCIVVYDGNTFQKQFYMNNLDAIYDVDVFSDSGNEFLADQGYPTLTCVLTGAAVGPRYQWSSMNNDGTYSLLAEDTVGYQDYIAKRLEYNRLINGFENGSILRNAYYYGTTTNQTMASNLAAQLKVLDKKQFVVGNKIYHVNIKQINNFKIFVCSVSDENDNALGTDSIKIINKGSSGEPYTLVLNNGSQVFNYSQDGVSPCDESNENPYSIPELTFTVYSAKGREIPLEAIRAADIEWTIPEENTLITNAVVGNKSLSYDISKRYSISKTDNNIGLKVTYDGYTMTTKTNLTFTKEGELGTNGSGLVVKIGVYNGGSQVKDEYPWAATNNGTSFIDKNFTRLSAQLWKGGDKLFDSSISGDSEQGKRVDLTWQMLKNRYSSSVSDGSSFSIADGVLSDGEQINLKTLCDELDAGTVTSQVTYENTPANIVKLTLRYDGLVYYATLPIITVYRTNASFNASLVQNTGFRYAVYADNGRAPAYDNHLPFTLSLSTLVNEVREDISISTVDGYNPSYSFGYLGTIYEDRQRISKHYLMNANGQGTKNQKYVKPLDSYDGLSVTNALYSIVKIGTDKVFVHIPIHFMLNKYSNAAINEWDGNSISIDNDQNVILAPQMGAGHKNTDNTFTGVVMGDVKNSGSNAKETGLFGYASGKRSIFLDANTGKAEFGVEGKGQVLIEPSSDKAILKSGNYSTSDGTGMQIDLTTPQIKFGSGHFEVDSSGHLKAVGGGSIAGWNIGDDKLFKDKVGMSSDNTQDTNVAFWAGKTIAASAPFRVNYAGHITATGGGQIGNWTLQTKDEGGAFYSNNKVSFDTDRTGVYLGSDGISLGRNHFQVDDDGNLFADSATIDGIVTAREGYIGNGSNGFIIKSNYIANGKEDYDDTNEGIYLGTRGIGLGAGKFYVTRQGKLFANDIDIEGKIKATSGTIADWKINSKSLTKDKVGISSDYVNDNSIAFWAGSTAATGGKFRVTYGGKLYATDADISGKITAETEGKIANWNITTGKIYSGSMSFGTDGLKLGDNFSVSAAGALIAKSGSIGDWKILNGYIRNDSGTVYLHPNAIKVGNFIAYSNGAIGGGQSPARGASLLGATPAGTGTWSIDQYGRANFAGNVNTSGALIASNAQISGGYLSPASVTAGSGGASLDNYFAKTVTVNNLLANKASIADLNAAKARISTIEANYLTATKLSSMSVTASSFNSNGGYSILGNLAISRDGYRNVFYGNASSASYADSAGYATSAGSATNATNSTYAENATKFSGQNANWWQNWIINKIKQLT